MRQRQPAGAAQDGRKQVANPLGPAIAPWCRVPVCCKAAAPVELRNRYDSREVALQYFSAALWVCDLALPQHPAITEQDTSDGARQPPSAGVGEAPILRQATFTIWESQAAMDSYARSGAHLAAIKAAMQGNYFSESMFVRFQPFDAEGTWKGKQLD